MAAAAQAAHKLREDSSSQDLQGEMETSRGDQGQEDLLPGLQVSCKTIAVEVARILAPDLIASLQITISAALTQIQTEVTLNAARITGLEQRVSNLEEELLGTQSQMLDIITQNKLLKEKTEDLENRSRRSNLRIIGLPETIQASELLQICATELPQALGLQTSYPIERAHRVGPPPKMGADSKKIDKPRQVIAKFLNYADKVTILQLYKKSSTEVKLRGHKVLLFSDYSAEVAKRRRAFSSICSELFKRKQRFYLQFPATLHIYMEGGASRSFRTPEEARSYLDASSSETSQSQDTTKRRRTTRTRSASDSMG